MQLRDVSAREGRFSARVLQAWSATGAPAGLTVRAATADTPAEILLYDEIGPWGVTAKAMLAAIAQAGAGKLRVRINSPGGDVFDGMAMYNALRAHPGGVETVVDGLAASAASFIALAGSGVSMAETSTMMIHNAWGFVVGNKADLTETAAVLGKMDGLMAAIYAAKTDCPAEDMAAMMDAETWLTAAEAKAAGFCDEITLPVDATAKAAVTKAKLRAVAAKIRAAFDPDGDGDDDAAEAVALIQQAIGSCADAIEALTGTGPAEGDDSAAMALAASDRDRLARRVRIAVAS